MEAVIRLSVSTPEIVSVGVARIASLKTAVSVTTFVLVRMPPLSDLDNVTVGKLLSIIKVMLSVPK